MRFKKKTEESPLFAISPARCFESLFVLQPVGKKLASKSHMLRDQLGVEEGEALVYGALEANGLAFHIAADLSHEGDGVEIFLDTRPGTSAIIGRFCHRFVFDGDFREETPFRTPEESHPTCSPKDIAWKGDEGGVTLHLTREAIHGYRPGIFGFAMRVRTRGKIQHLGVSAREGAFENHPAQWAQLEVK